MYGQYDDIDVRPSNTSTITIAYVDVRRVMPLYLRIWTVVRLPWDVIRFVVIGKTTIGGPFKVRSK